MTLPLNTIWREKDGEIFSLVLYKNEKHRIQGTPLEFQELKATEQKKRLMPIHKNGITISFQIIKEDTEGQED